MDRNLRTVVTGIAPISAIGIGKENVWNPLSKGKTGLILQDYFINDKVKEKLYAHKIKNFNIKNFDIDEGILADIATWKGEEEWIDLAYLLVAVKLAIEDSKLTLDLEDTKNKVGLVLTHENPGLDEFYKKVINESYSLLKDKNPISEEEYFYKFFSRFQKQAYDLQTFMFLFHIAKSFGIHGYSLFLNNACASGLYALEAASDIIKSGKCDSVVVAASDQASIFKYLWFKGLGMYPEDGLIKPFAVNRNGFAFGDGGAGIVLENLENAQKRGANIYAEYLGGGFSLEGWKVAIPNLISDSYRNAISETLKSAEIKTDEIDLLVPHGVGTTVTDAYEAKAITNIFGKNFNKPLITALKPYVGHSLGCSALLETIILLMMMENNLVLPTLNVQKIDPKLHIELVTTSQEVNLKTVMKTACGFAGYNGAAVFRKI